MSFDIRRWLVLLIVSAGLCTSIVYIDVQTCDLSYADSPLYVRMYLGDPGGSWAYRPVVPWLARLVPELPPSFFPLSVPARQNFKSLSSSELSTLFSYWVLAWHCVS